MFVLLLLSIPLSIIAANTRSILVAVGQDPEIATEAGHFALYSIPIPKPSFSNDGEHWIHNFATYFRLWILVFESGLGTKGTALANSISYWINVLILGLYVKYSSSCEESWTGFSKEAFHNIGNFLTLGIPSALMVCLEFWSFEALVLLSGLLPNPKGETLNITALVWKIPFGLSGVVSTRVSNELGARCPRVARLAINVVLVMAISQGILIGLVLMMARDTLAYASSNEIQVVKYVSKLMPILAIANILDGLQCVLSGNKI
ncbi:Multi antimicrobial extrusion protein [Parasponia andersonii]|uniref:Multi antimicrobial extrusion protein n=1 Tax=Parasponia andersonii TaxID=3476 RepID=A0A2P5A422_PARAD|nr:Multi antimicrobial extrusion protein [Parasponia andersonii]